LTRSVVVVGAGVVGSAVAYALAQSGHRVAVLEQGVLGGAVTGASLACLGTHMIDLKELPLLIWSCQAWKELARNLTPEFEYVQCGQLRFIEREADIPAAEHWIETEREHGLEPELLDAEAVRQVEPGLTGPIVGATHSPGDAVVNPFLAVRALLRAARDSGADVHAHVPARKIEVSNGRVVGVMTDDGLMTADSVVLATGPWTAELAATCGVDLPIRPRKAQCLATVAQPPTIRKVVGACESSGGVEAGYTQIQQARSGQILFNTVLAGGLSDDGAQNQTPEVDPRFVLDSIATLLRLFPCLETIELLRSWVRFEAVAPDDRFLIGPAGPEGLFIAAGDAGTGFVRAPAVGHLIGQMLDGKESSFHSDLYAPSRFAASA
jgi:glycine/D-amino acid oxidase-like deaminating enzyme